MIKWHALVTHLYVGENGHRYEYHLKFRQIVKKLGYNYCGYTNNRRLIKNIPREWEPILNWSESTSLFEMVKRLFCFVRIFSRRPKDEERYFFLESLSLGDLAALCLSTPLLTKKDRLYLLLRFDLETNGMSPFKRPLFRFGFRALKAILKKKLVLLSDSERVAEFFSAFLQPVTVLPILHTDDIPESFPSRPQSEIKLWWPGSPREEKGSSWIQKLMRSLTKEKMRLFISKEMQIDASIPVTYLEKGLPRKEYVERLMQSHVILLPYDPEAYFSRTSGPLVEAVFAGKVPFVREGSWLANELRMYNLEELIIDFESLDEIARLARDSTVLVKLAKMQKHYRAFHNLEVFGLLVCNKIAGEGEHKCSEDRDCAHSHIV